jgi:CubicO group peptidase (beta-lactamase class C family)
LELGLGWGIAAVFRESEKNGVLVRGKRSLEPPAVLTERDVFELGSVSRVFTGVLVHLAILEGKLRLDTTLGEKLPSLRGKPAGAITLEELGLHRSGLPFVFSEPPSVDPMNPVRGLKEKDLLAGLESWVRPAAPVARAPSNVGYYALGLLLEKTYARKFSDLFRAKLARPLGLGEAGIDRGHRRRGKFVPKVMRGYDPAGDAMPASEYPDPFGAAGGVEMNTSEMRNFLEKLVFPPNSPLGRAITAALDSGMGWDSEPGARLVSIKALTAGFAADLFLDRDGKRALFITSNSRIETTGLGKFALGLAPSDPLVARIGSGRGKTSNEEVQRLKGKYIFTRLLDDDEDAIDPARLASGEIEPSPKHVEVLEQFARLVLRLGPPKSTGIFLAPAGKPDEWFLIDGLSDAGEKIVLEGGEKDLRLRVQTRGASGKEYWFEYRKLEARPETFPAYEKE